MHSTFLAFVTTIPFLWVLCLSFSFSLSPHLFFGLFRDVCVKSESCHNFLCRAFVRAREGKAKNKKKARVWSLMDGSSFVHNIYQKLQQQRDCAKEIVTSFYFKWCMQCSKANFHPFKFSALLNNLTFLWKRSRLLSLDNLLSLSFNKIPLPFYSA